MFDHTWKQIFLNLKQQKKVPQKAWKRAQKNKNFVLNFSNINKAYFRKVRHVFSMDVRKSFWYNSKM